MFQFDEETIIIFYNDKFIGKNQRNYKFHINLREEKAWIMLLLRKGKHQTFPGYIKRVYAHFQVLLIDSFMSFHKIDTKSSS